MTTQINNSNPFNARYPPIPQIKEGMKIMGLSDTVYGLSWLITLGTQGLITTIGILLVTRSSVFEFSSDASIFLYFFSYYMSVIMFSFLLSTFFSRSKSAAILGTIMFFATYFPFYSVSDPRYEASRTEATSRGTRYSRSQLATLLVSVGPLPSLRNSNSSMLVATLIKNYPDLFEDMGDWRKRDTYIAALKYFYLPWVIAHAVFLIIHPYTPLAKYETLFDWVCYGGLPKVRTDPFFTWVKKVLAYCLAHFILSSQGLAAAALSFKYQLVHFVWICCVFFNCAYFGFKFYEDTVNPPTDVDLSGAMSPLDGIKRCGFAWACVIPAYLYCRAYPELSTISRSEVKRRKAEGKKED